MKYLANIISNMRANIMCHSSSERTTEYNTSSINISTIKNTRTTEDLTTVTAHYPPSLDRDLKRVSSRTKRIEQLKR